MKLSCHLVSMLALAHLASSNYFYGGFTSAGAPELGDGSKNYRTVTAPFDVAITTIDETGSKNGRCAIYYKQAPVGLASSLTPGAFAYCAYRKANVGNGACENLCNEWCRCIGYSYSANNNECNIYPYGDDDDFTDNNQPTLCSTVAGQSDWADLDPTGKFVAPEEECGYGPGLSDWVTQSKTVWQATSAVWEDIDEQADPIDAWSMNLLVLEGSSSCSDSSGSKNVPSDMVCKVPSQSGSAFGDPMTRFGGRTIRFYLHPDKYETLMGVGEYQLWGKVQKWASVGKHQWFTDFSLRAAQTDIITVSARRTISEYLNPTTLRTIDVTVEGIPRDQTGKLKTHGEKVSLMISTTNGLLGSANKEEAKITAPGMACKITSNKANKFMKTAHQLDHLHLDLSFSQLELGRAFGVLPELWGLQEMSKHTMDLLKTTDIHV